MDCTLFTILILMCLLLLQSSMHAEYVDGSWGDWGAWSSCSITYCGDGGKSRSRSCDNPRPTYGGSECEGTSEEYDSCFVRPCKPVTCNPPSIENMAESASAQFYLVFTCLLDIVDGFPPLIAMYSTQMLPGRTAMDTKVLYAFVTGKEYVRATARLSVDDFLVTTYNIQMTFFGWSSSNTSYDYTVEPPTVSCDLPQLTEDGGFVTLNCSTESYFTDFHCAFDTRVDHGESKTVPSTEVMRLQMTCFENATFCVSQCQLKRPVSDMLPGNNELKGIMTDTLTYDKVIIQSEWMSFSWIGAPVITVDGVTVSDGHSKSVVVDTSIDVTCRIPGGSSGISSATLTCADDPVQTVEGGVVNQTLMIDEGYQGRKCVCLGSHVLYPYDNSTEIFFNVLVPAEIKYFKIGSERTELEVEKSTEVAIECQAKGNPLPRLTLRRLRSQETIPIPAAAAAGPEGGTVKSIRFDHTMDACTDTDTYQCVASNGIGDDSVGSVLVSVKCPPALVSPQTLQTAYQVKLGDPLTATFPIICHPVPNVFFLFMLETLSSSGGKRKRRLIVDSSQYDIVYNSTTKPYGEVDLSFTKVEAFTYGEYVLVVGNEVGTALEIEFHVIQDKQGSASDDSSDSDTDLPVLPIVLPIAGVLLMLVIVGFYRKHGNNNREKNEGPPLAVGRSLGLVKPYMFGQDNLNRMSHYTPDSRRNQPAFNLAY